jgi:tRNA(fMet)-specific endonuclease VapC
MSRPALPCIENRSILLYGISLAVLLDSTFIIAAEREGLSVAELLSHAGRLPAADYVGMSVISVMELAHGEARSDSASRAALRETFLTELMSAMEVHPVTKEIARRAGRLDGALAKHGIQVASPDMLIGVTALELGYSLVTRNLRHFDRIPGLSLIKH